MSSSSHNYYHSSRSQGTQREDRSLPSIRDVVGAELDGRVIPSPYAFDDVMSALPSSHTNKPRDHRGPTLPPIRASNHPSPPRSNAYGKTQGRYPAAVYQVQGHHSSSTGYPLSGHDESGHIYGVLRTSGTAARDLVHATPPAERPHGILRQASTTQTYDPDPDKRHKCDYCGKKFDRPSSLEVHLRTHTGSQPFTCEWPGCNRTFSVRSNMLRHLRSHEKSNSFSQGDGSFAYKGDDYDRYDSDSQEKTSSQYFHPPPAQPSGSRYYSSSRRK